MSCELVGPKRLQEAGGWRNGCGGMVFSRFHRDSSQACLLTSLCRVLLLHSMRSGNIHKLGR